MILMPPHRNLIAQAHNGSGKTTCFVLAMLSRVDVGLKAPQVGGSVLVLLCWARIGRQVD